MIDRMSSLILKSNYLIENLFRIVCNEFQKKIENSSHVQNKTRDDSYNERNN